MTPHADGLAIALCSMRSASAKKTTSPPERARRRESGATSGFADLLGHRDPDRSQDEDDEQLLHGFPLVERARKSTRIVGGQSPKSNRGSGRHHFHRDAVDR